MIYLLCCTITPMSKIDKIKEEKSDYKEIFKALIYLVLGILTGVSTIAYQILIHKISAYMIVISGLGLLIVFLISLYALKVWYKMQELNKEMEDA